MSETQLIVWVVMALGGAGAAWLLRGSPLLSVAPRVWAGPDWLLARTSLPVMLLTLFSHRRLVAVDGRTREITIRRRFLWVVRRVRRIAFADVESILYFLNDFSPDTLLGMSGDTFDSFKVQLRLQDGSVVHIFSFLGPGTFQRGWDSWWWIPDWYYAPERLFDVSGAQALQSREFLDKLQALLRVPVGRPPA